MRKPLAKFMDEHKAHHAITFHSSIKKAQAFADRHIEQYQATVNSYHVNGKLTTNKRSRIMDYFKRSPKAIMTNARCLTEGVDVPAIDVVYFCDPKNSKIDIVQAAGRALRRSTGKKFGYIVVPIYHNCTDHLEHMIENGPFKNLVTVVRALLDHDERLIVEITKIKLGEGLRKNGVLNISLDAPLELITMEGFEYKLKRSLFEQLITKTKLPWRDFFNACSFVRQLNLKNEIEWKKYSKSGEKPEDIPVDPANVYKNKGWKGIGDWLGTESIAPKNKRYRSFDKARSFARTLGFKNTAEWERYSKTKEKPIDIPACPDHVYKNEGWIGMGDWLGTGATAPKNRQYRPFDKARSFARTLNLKSGEEWKKYCKKDEKPDDIPFSPNNIYKDKGWISWGDWLGTGRTANQNKQYMPFNEARLFVQAFNFKSRAEYIKHCKKDNSPNDIPATPDQVYQTQGWISWGDWLGTGSIAPKNKKYRRFDQARMFAQALNLKSGEEWRKYCKTGKKPQDIPKSPDHVYRDMGWIGWGDWLGTESIAPKNKRYRSFDKARSFARTLNLKNSMEWFEYCKSSKKPNDIPTTPHHIYKNKGWQGMEDWLGYL